MYIIKDWADNRPFGEQQFSSFEEAEEYLSEYLGDSYDTDRQEYYITEV
jgi:hypothetical protein